MKKYQVMILDEWENLYNIGFYDNLQESINDINNFLEVYNISIDKLEEYVDANGISFNKTIKTEDDSYIFIKGFIFE